jgi:hypothetical protein
MLKKVSSATLLMRFMNPDRMASVEYTIRTYLTPEQHYAFRVESAATKWDASMEDPQFFSANLSWLVNELSQRGTVTVQQGEPPVPEELIPEQYWSS